LNVKYRQRVLLHLDSKNATELKKKFFNMKDGILCTYLGGSFTEGVDFKDDRARAVVVVGIGYTNRSILTRADETAYKVKPVVTKTKEWKEDAGWQYVVKVPTIRKIRQALGRVIRSDTDYGVRILLDIRYTKSTIDSIYNEFPERNEFEDINTRYLKEQLIKDFEIFTGGKNA